MKPQHYKFAFWTWYGLVFLSSFFTNGWISKINDPNNDVRSDYFLHAIVFFVFPVLAMYLTKEEKKQRTFYLLIAACLLLACCSELIQYFIPYRSFNVNDIFANIIGLGVGTMLVLLIKSTREGLSKTN